MRLGEFLFHNDNVKGSLKFYTIYAPPAHPDGTRHSTKAEAEKAEAQHHVAPSAVY
jgi:hypothetical protein